MVVICACPLDKLAALPILDPFDENCTVPVGAGPPFCVAVTVAVNVTLAPCAMVLFDDVNSVVVEGRTATVTGADRLDAA